ncbi:MAG TPA: hypothetical protein VHE55_11515 [Fimbriimonadaceae bacterium]|nr:hypothetical protein [Fimbriimonadaceae bacterium]
MRFAAPVLVALLASAAHACLWDSDTLAEEAANHMDLVRIITGRFERNPPLYYQMRLQRVSGELAKNPANLDNYDNAAVACDRLGNDVGALKWIGKKRTYMEGHRLTAQTNPEDWYRYYANAGTFHAHLWFRRGRKPDELGEVKEGKNLLLKALAINPNAHFGREKVQIKVFDWVIDGGRKSLGSYLEDMERDLRPDGEAESDAKGLAGLVMLGNAWESVDTFQALEYRLSDFDKGSLAQFAMLRARELMSQGAKPLAKADEEYFAYPFYRPDQQTSAFNEKEFVRLRAEADAWQKTRTDFMVARLKVGRHPDTDKTFWSGYSPAPAPEVRDQSFWTTAKLWMRLSVVATICVIAVPCLLAWVIYKIVKVNRRGR